MNMLLAETDFNTMILGIITTLFGFFSLVFTGIMAYRMAAMNKEQKIAQAEVKDVLVKQNKESEKQDVKIDILVKQTDGLIQKFGDAKLNEGVLKERDLATARENTELAFIAKGIEQERNRVEEQNVTFNKAEDIPVTVENKESIKVKETP